MTDDDLRRVFADAWTVDSRDIPELAQLLSDLQAFGLLDPVAEVLDLRPRQGQLCTVLSIACREVLDHDGDPLEALRTLEAACRLLGTPGASDVSIQERLRALRPAVRQQSEVRTT